MKKIINGKVYETEKATKIGEYDNGGGWRDFNHIEETLYRKRTGEYFLHGEGGPMTQYARRDGSGWTGSATIIPYSYEDARKWAEKNMDADAYEAEFGEVTEEETVAIHVKIPSAADNKLRTEAAKRGISITALVLDMIERL